MKENSSKTTRELEKKLSKKRKEKSEKIIKEKLDKKELDYDAISLVLEVFGKAKFQWNQKHFDGFDSKPNSFWGKNLPRNNRECIMLGITLGTMRNKILYNLRDKQLTENELGSLDELIWNFVWYQWEEARIFNDNKDQ